MDTLDTGDYHGHMEELDGVTKRGKLIFLYYFTTVASESKFYKYEGTDVDFFSCFFAC